LISLARLVFGFPSPLKFPKDPLLSEVKGVGHFSGEFICWAKLRPVMAGVMCPARFASLAAGVAQDPNSLADVGSAGIIRPHDTPFRIEPQDGQVSENSSKPSTNEHWGVLHEDESRSNLAKDPSKLSP